MTGRGSVEIDESSQGSALALNLVDPLEAPELARYLRQTLPTAFWVTDWTATQGNLISGHSVVATDRCADVGLAVDHCHV